MRPQRWDAILRRVPCDTRVIGAEVGVWKGALSSRLLVARPLLELWMIDRWQAPIDGDSYLNSGSEMAALPQLRFDEARALAIHNVRFAGDRAHVLTLHSALAAGKFRDRYFDFVFIDADHSYDGVVRDVTQWGSKVKPGGWLCGHDWCHHGRNDVELAVTKLLGRVELDHGNTWFWQAPNA